MLRLKSLTISKFRSFKHAELHFSKGFTCVVGPNGSGKSSICYSLMFGLGESSLKRLDGARMLSDLINNKVSYSKDTIPKAYVKIELEGDEKYEITRYARADGKSLYKVNGKKYSRQEVVEILKKHNFDVNDTNTIAQTEINRLANLNPKETRQLIDEASGIKEFEFKKQESLRELEKVNQAIGTQLMVLNERKGFLQDLKEQKETAEKYTAMKARLNVLNYSKSYLKLQDAQKSFDKHSSEMALRDSEKQKRIVEMNTISSKINVFNEERQILTRELTGKTASSSEVGRNLESIKAEISKTTFELENCDSRMVEAKANIEKLEQQSCEISKSVANNSSWISDATKRMEQITPDVSRFDSNAKVDPIEIDSRIRDTDGEILKLQADLDAVQEEMHRLSSDSSGYEAQIGEILKGIEENKAIEKKEKDAAKEAASKYKELSSRLQKHDANVKGFERDINGLAGKLSSIDSDLLKYREQRLVSYSRESSITDKIARSFGEKNGFYGSASQLCTYDPKYAIAIETSAGNRLNHFVVDTIPTASKIIEYMKSNDIGRATFIPIKDLTKSHIASENEIGEKAVPLIKLVRFDPKFKSAFEYIFGNTYLIDDINHSKKLGVGKHRYVTESGELVEQSGVVSGGAVKNKLSLSSLNSKLEDLETQKNELSRQKAAYEASLASAKKDYALFDMQIEKLKSNEADADSSASLISERISRAARELESAKEKLEAIKNAIGEKAKRRSDIEGKIKVSKEKGKTLYKELTDLSKRLSKSGMSRAEKEKLEKLRGELEELKTKKTSWEKESEMNLKRIEELNDEIRKNQNEIAKQGKEKAGKEARRKKLEGERLELEVQISKSTRASEDAYKKIQIIDLDIAKLSTDKGKLQSELDSKEREIADHRVAKGQLETRISDLKAELSTFDKSTEVVSEGIDEIEKDAAVLNSKISDLGNVNLKAPEVYAEKMNDVKEAMSRVETLNAERDAVMKMIEEIDKKKLEIFIQTFTAVNNYFRGIYKYVFPETAYLELDNLKDPFNSGLLVKIEGDSSRRGTRQMSGGQKTLLTLMLMFSIHMYKPSSIYIFDEVDAALDKENSKKLSRIIKQLSHDSQFIVVSHNDSLVVDADVAIGVAFDKSKNESRAVGLEISSIAGTVAGSGRGAL